jgi:hypothetical protein
MKTKLDTVREAAERGDWQQAIAIAARFPQLGTQRAAILDAHVAFQNPRFAQQIGKDPAALIAAGCAALRGKYGF